MKRLLKWFAFILTLLACLLLWLTNTSSGLTAVVGIANSLAPVEVSHDNLSGNLSEFTADSLSIATPELTIAFDQLTLRWHPLALFRKSFYADQLHIESVLVTSAARATQDSKELPPLVEIEIPVEIKIADLHVSKLTLNENVLAMEILGVIDITDQQWLVENGSAQLSSGDVNVSASVSPANNWQHALHVSLNEAQVGPIQFSMIGDHEKTQLKALVDSLSGNAQLDVVEPFEKFIWTLGLEIERLSPLNYEGFAMLQGSGEAYSGTLQGDVTFNAVELKRSSIDLEYLDGALQSTLLGSLNDWPVSVSALISKEGITGGRVQVGNKQIAEEVNVTSTDITIAGPWERLKLSVDGEAIVKVPTTIALRGEVLDLKEARFNQVAVQLADGSIEGSASVEWSDDLLIESSLSVLDVDLQRFDDRLPGVLSALLSLRSRQGQTDVDISNVVMLSPATEGPVTGSGKIQFANSAVRSAQLNLSVNNDNYLKLVKLANQQAVSLDMDISSLGAFINGAEGKVKGKFELDLDTFSVDGSANAKRLDVPSLVALDELDVIASHESGQQQLNTTGSALVVNGVKLSAFNMALNGSVDAHTIQGTLAYGSKQSLDIAIEGVWADSQWRYQVNQFDLGYDELRASLSSPAQGLVSQVASELSAFCLALDASGNACASFRMAGNVTQATVEVTLPPNAASVAPLLAQFELPPMQFPEGVELTLNIDRENDFLEILDLDAKIPLVLLATPEGEHIEIRDVVAIANGDQQLINLNAGMQLAGGAITTQGRVENLSDPILDTRVNLALPELSALTALFTDLDLQQGEIDGAFTLKGKPAAPQYSGELHARNLKLAWPSLGAQHEGELQIDFGSGRAGEVSGKLISANGEAMVMGTLALTPVPDVKLTVVGKQFLIADTSDLAVSASPDLQLNWQDSVFSITGDIAIDRAFTSLDLPALQSQVVISNDVVFNDQQQESDIQKTGGATVDIGVEFAQPGRVSGRGINGEVGGRLRVTQEPGTAALGNGVLNLTGTYQAFGQALNIENGQLIYTNTPINDPVINVYASRKIDEVTVGVRVGGRASTLVTRLESTPSMPESDILHYLVLGRAPDASSSAENSQLASAAVSLAISQSEVGVQSIGEKLGVTDLGITQEFGALALAVGKQLSPNLYVSYTVGLLEPLDVAKIRYTLSRRISLEAEVSDETRASLRYRIEKD